MLLTVLTLSSWLRPVIGQKTWRIIHYSGFACWVAALVHGVFSGSDTSVAWVTWMYVVSAAAVGSLIALRVLTASRPRAQLLQARAASNPAAGRAVGAVEGFAGTEGRRRPVGSVDSRARLQPVACLRAHADGHAARRLR